MATTVEAMTTPKRLVIAPVNLLIARLMWLAGTVGMVVLVRTLAGLVQGELRTLSA